MQLFTTQINDIQAQIEKLQAEQKKLQDLENATVGALANLKAVVANVEGDETAITILKSAINNLFETSAQDTSKEVESLSATKVEASAQQPKFGTSARPCPATPTGECLNPECNHETFTCEGCGKETPYCYGGDEDELCNDCWTKNPPPEIETTDETREKIQHVKKLQEERLTSSEVEGLIDEDLEVETAQLIDTHERELESEEMIQELNSRAIIQLNEQAQWDSKTDTLYVWFKFKKIMKKWAEHYDIIHEDAVVLDKSDDSRVGFKYLLTVLRSANVDHSEWVKQQTKFNFTLTPEENRKALQDTEKYHALIQKNKESEIVEIEANNESLSRKNYQHLIESLPEIEPLPDDVLDNADDHPAFSFIATGMGWLNVTHEGDVLGIIFSNKEGWELESGEKFATREEAANALYQSSQSVAA